MTLRDAKTPLSPSGSNVSAAGTALPGGGTMLTSADALLPRPGTAVSAAGTPVQASGTLLRALPGDPERAGNNLEGCRIEHAVRRCIGDRRRIDKVYRRIDHVNRAVCIRLRPSLLEGRSF